MARHHFLCFGWTEHLSPVTFATTTSHPLPPSGEAYDSNTHPVNTRGDAVTQPAADTVTRRHLVAGNTKQIKTSSGWSVWSLCGAEDVERQQGARGKAAVFHLLENQTESHWFSHDIPNPPKHTPLESDGWRGEHAHHLKYKHAPQPRALPPTTGLRPPPPSTISP